MGGADIDLGADQPGALRHPVMVAVDRERGIRNALNDRTAALVFGPTPGIASSQARASATGISRKKPRSRLPARACTARKTAWIRGAFSSGQVTPEISAWTPRSARRSASPSR